MSNDRILSRLQSGLCPGEPELSGAARLEHWRLHPPGPYVLQGRVGDHIYSGVVFALDPAAGWARLADRWLVLGTRAPGPQPVIDNEEIMRSAARALVGQPADAELIAAHARELAGRAREAGLTMPAYLLDLVAETAERADG